MRPAVLPVVLSPAKGCRGPQQGFPKPMTSDHPLSRLSYSNRVAKRAQYEAFEFSLSADGVTVRNCSHADPTNHEYQVTVTDGVPSACTCPADSRFEGACKHRVAVAIRRPLIEAATTRVATDGGVSNATDDATRIERTEVVRNPDDTCDDCLDAFPCWECGRSGRKELPE